MESPLLEQYDAAPSEKDIGLDFYVVGDTLRAYNRCIAEMESFERENEKLANDLKKIESDLKEIKKVLESFKTEVVEERMVGQVYHVFEEMIIKKVFGGAQFPVYTVDNIKEAFKDDTEDSIFDSEEQKEEFESKWADIKLTIGWDDESDMEMLKSLEEHEYGYREQRRSISQLKDSLEKAKNTKIYKESDLKGFERLIYLSELLI